MSAEPPGVQGSAPAGGAANPRFLASVADPAAPPVLRLDALASAAAAVLRAAADAVGARAVLGPAGALVAATRAQHAALAAALAADPAHAALGQAIAAALAHQYGPPPPPTRVGTATWAWGQRTYVMGILNLTPDSFSGDGLPDVAAAVAQARAFAAAGADLLDVGGESTRPGAPPLPADQELARVIPVIAALRDAVPLPISVDTYKASVAAAALAAGACVVNDVTALRADPAIAEVAAAHGAALVLMHNRPAAVARGPLGSHNPAVAYADLLGEVLRELRAAVARAETAGVPPAQLWIDPGIGFGKTREQNLELLARLGEFRALGRPLLLGTSRKSVIGLTLGLPVDQRVEGTAATVALGIRAGADVVRVHDVRSMALVARLSDAILRSAG
ncbi:MAG TPA: dihydropteroate synthase [Chloroflexota bacterium]|nr:dihydropteroate synthase [Chloroflexota bacterium]